MIAETSSSVTYQEHDSDRKWVVCKVVVEEAEAELSESLAVHHSKLPVRDSVDSLHIDVLQGQIRKS